MDKNFRTAVAALFPLALFLSGCGLIIGQAMVAGTGLKKLEVREGRLADLKRGAYVLILTPFETVGTGFETARGDDGARLAEGFAKYGTFKPLFHFVQEPGKVGKVAAELTAMTPGEVAALLKLENPPDFLMTGTILSTSTVVAPMKGVVLETSHRLEFTDLRSKARVAVVTEIKELYPDAIPLLARSLDSRIGK